MTDVPSQPPSLIDVDSPCMSCGYNLRGLQSDSNCPECGHIISASLRGDMLRFSDPKWLAKLRLGASLKLWAIIVSIVLSFVAGIAGAFFGLPILLVQFATLVGSVLALWGTWCITSQEPRIALTDGSLTLRKFIRTCAIASGVGGLLYMVADVGPFPALMATVAWLLSVTGYAASYGELFYFRRFANRVPDPDLVKSTRRMIIVLPIFFVVIVLAFVAAVVAGVPLAGPPPVGAGTTTAAGAAAMPAAPAAPGAGLGGLATGGMCGFGIFGLIIFFWYVRLLTKYKAAFTEAIAQATAAPTSTDPTNPASPMAEDQPTQDPPTQNQPPPM